MMLAVELITAIDMVTTERAKRSVKKQDQVSCVERLSFLLQWLLAAHSREI